jgi:hypothetical protein
MKTIELDITVKLRPGTSPHPRHQLRGHVLPIARRVGKSHFGVLTSCVFNPVNQVGRNGKSIPGLESGCFLADANIHRSPEKIDHFVRIGVDVTIAGLSGSKGQPSDGDRASRQVLVRHPDERPPLARSLLFFSFRCEDMHGFHNFLSLSPIVPGVKLDYTGNPDLDLWLAHHTLPVSSTQRIFHQSRFLRDRGGNKPHSGKHGWSQGVDATLACSLSAGV